MTRSLFAAMTASLGLIVSTASALEGDPYAGETQEQRDARMAWWREAKFGMFIHWGIYAVPAGIHEGKPVGGYGEWIMRDRTIPVATYRNFAKDFTATKYDPVAWATLAKETGMRYMVITSKHHDGFALFPSQASDWDVADATPWKKDLIGPLAKAARAQGLKFGLYYSQAQDWTHRGGAKMGMGEGDGWDASHKGPFGPYIDKIAVPQVKEILTRYQPDVLWWDTPHLMNQEHAAKFAKLLALKPGIIHNDRLGGGYHGDTGTPEQHIPATGIPGRDWETCMTLNDTWGYKKNDQNWKPASVLIRNLVDIVSKGGNYLLNVGPTPEGEIPEQSVQILGEVGAWMKVNHEAIYGTHASPFKSLPWGRCTTKGSGDERTLYLHVFDWPADGKLLVPRLGNTVKSAQLLAGGAHLPVKATDRGPELTLPAKAPDAVSSTVKLVIQGAPELVQPIVSPDQDGVIRLLPDDAKLQGEHLVVEMKGDVSNIGYWTNAQATASWKLRVPAKGKYVVNVETAVPAPGAVLTVQDVGNLAFSVPKTANHETFQMSRVGEVDLAPGAVATLTLKPVVDGWQPVNVRKVELVPIR